MRRVSDFRISDRVLVDTRIKEIGITGDFCKIQLGGHCDGEFHIKTQVHLHPGVSPEALLEELELLWDWLSPADKAMGTGQERLDELRTAREAANAPKLKEGDEVWVRSEVGPPGDASGGLVAIRPVGWNYARPIIPVHPDDIRTD